MPVVISSHHDDFAMPREIAQEPRRFSRRRLIMHQIAEDDQTPRRVFIHERSQPVGDRRHSPHRHQTACCALAQFVAEMQVRHREPELGLMEKRESSIEKNFIGDKRLVHAQWDHGPGKLSLAPARINRYWSVFPSYEDLA